MRKIKKNKHYCYFDSVIYNTQLPHGNLIIFVLDIEIYYFGFKYSEIFVLFPGKIWSFIENSRGNVT